MTEAVTGFPPEFLPGYVVYLAAIFVPGYGLGELLGRWKEGDTLVERAGYSFGLGLSADTVVYALKTAGVGVGGFRLAGMGISVVYLMVFLGVAALGASYLRRRSFARPPSFALYDAAVFAMVAVLAAAIYVYFAKYPYFPDYQIDYAAHATQATGLITGAVVTVPRMLLYGAGNYQIAASILAVGGWALLTAQRTMAIMVLLSPFLVFSASSRIFASRRAALFTTALYALSGIVWVPMVYAVGLYANFVGVLLEVLLVSAFLDLSSNLRSRTAWVADGAILVASYFSHYTVITILGSFLFFGLGMALLRRPGYKSYLAVGAAFLAPGAVGALVFEKTLGTILAISYTVGSPVVLSTYLSGLLSPIPALAYIAVDVSNDLGFVALMALLAVALYKGYKSRYVPALLLALWFVAILVAAPEDYLAWRFSFEAAIPLLLLSGYGLHALLPEDAPRTAVRRSKLKAARGGGPPRLGSVVVALLFLVPAVAGSPTWFMVQNVTANASQEAQLQGELLHAMSWMGQNTPAGSKFLSVTEPRFEYAQVVIDRNTTYQYFRNAPQAITYAGQLGAQYIIVTHFDVRFSLSTLAPDFYSTNLPWYTYPSQNGIAMVYNNTDVMIFEVTPNG